jgi:hypothetical protein
MNRNPQEGPARGYLYETHFHTSLSSACGRSRGPEYLARYKRLGYAGIIVTDHFWRGNCAVDRRLPWAEFVRAFCRGYEETREAGEKIGLDIFFGWEETFDGDDYLVYGLDKQWLLDHPEVCGWSRREQLEQVHRHGGCVVQAHPFRDRDYIPAIHLGLKRADAFEAYNAGNDAEFDAQALAFIERHGLSMTSGSDIHHAEQFEDEELGGVIFDRKLHSIKDYVEAIRSGAPRRLRVPRDRFNGPVRMPAKSVWLHGERTRRVRERGDLFG